MFVHKGYLYTPTRKAVTDLEYADKGVMTFFEERKPKESVSLTTDGKRLFDAAGNVLAEWKGGKVYIYNDGSALGATIAERLRRTIKKNKLV